MSAFINPPARIPFWLRIGILISERITGKTMLPARILAWYPKAALGSGVLEALVAHEDGQMDKRMLKLIRMTASFAAGCPFCIDMNAFKYQECGISDEEAEALRLQADPATIPTFSERERLAIVYSRLISQTPLVFPLEIVEHVKSVFSEREMFSLASTAAQVKYWARLIPALGIPPAGYTDECVLSYR